ncbi:MAG TPA: serine hydrolase domain-containing protein, partial [Dehalococcoidia bacterium]|nr:serine hydrolase domain-containing protein [Dehalococcoidia bacterium]
DDPILYADKNRAWAPRELVDLALARDPYFAPGAGFHYCNTNYVLLGMILERVTGQKLGSVLHQHAIDRAGLQHTFFIPEDPIEGQMATPFYPSGQEITDPFDPSVYWAIGSMASSAADLIEWVWALYRAQTVLDPTQVREMIDDSVVAELLPDFAESRYGLGVIIGTFTGTNSGPGVGHSGRWDGTSTDAYYFKDIETAVVVLQNVQFWPPKVGDEAVLIAILNTLSEMRISRQDVAADSQYGHEDSISSDSGFPRGRLRWAR